MLGTTVKIRLGPFKGYRGPVVEVKGNSVRVELEMKIVTGKQALVFHFFSAPGLLHVEWILTIILYAVARDAISDNVSATTPSR